MRKVCGKFDETAVPRTYSDAAVYIFGRHRIAAMHVFLIIGSDFIIISKMEEMRRQIDFSIRLRVTYLYFFGYYRKCVGYENRNNAYIICYMKRS